MIPFSAEQAFKNADSIKDFSPELSRLILSILPDISLEKKILPSWGIVEKEKEAERWFLKYKGQLVSDNYVDSIREHHYNEIIKPRKIQTALVQASENGAHLSLRQNIIGKHDVKYLDNFLAYAPQINSNANYYNIDLLFVGVESIACYLNSVNYFADCDLFQIPSSITLVESRPQSLAFGAYLFDYTTLFELARTKKISIKVIFHEHVDGIFSQYTSHLHSAIPSAYYRTQMFTSPNVDQVLLEFIDKVFSPESLYSVFLSQLGDSGDEINMLQQACKNVVGKNSINIIDFDSEYTKDIPQQTPVILVGSGPSLDDNIELIRQFESNHFIFCAGSSIRTLMANNIVPDCLILLERGPSLYDDLASFVSEGFSLKHITLICSLSVDSRIPSLFKKTIFFNREPNSPTEFLSLDSCCDLQCAGPESLNAALEILCKLKFESIFGFGVDFGSPTETYTRSKDAMGDYQRVFEKPVLGSNKKTFYTSNELQFSCLIFDLLLSRYPNVSFSRHSAGLPLNNAISNDISSNNKELLPKPQLESCITVKIIDYEDSKQKDLINLISETRVALTQKLVYFKKLYLDQSCWNSDLHKELASILWPDHKSGKKQLAASKIIRQFAFYAGMYLRINFNEDVKLKEATIDWYCDSILQLYSFSGDILIQELV